MSFDVNLYTFSKEVNSTAQPTGTGTVYACVSNANFDIINPRLPLNLGAAANPTAYNYCRVSDWSRYYWINRWSWESGLWVAYCSVDPLASWKTAIGGTSAYVIRAAGAYDTDLIDDLYPTKGGPTITDVGITAPWSDADLDYSQGSFVVGLINKFGATQYLKMTPTEFQTFCLTAFSDSFFNGVKDQMWLTKAIFDPMQYVSSVTWFPLLTGGGTQKNAYLGYWDTGITGLDIGTYNTRSVTVTLPKHPQAASRGGWVNSSPLTSYVLDLRPFGRIAIDPADVYGETNITLITTYDWITGVAILRVVKGSATTGTPILIQQAQLGLSVQLSQVLRDYWGGINGVVSSVANIASGGISGIISGAMGAVNSAVQAKFPDVTTSGVNAGFAGLYGSWHLIGTFYLVADEDLAHRGRPLCQVRQLSTLSGYQLVTDTDLQIPCTKAEMDMIRGYLESGYYYE